MKKIFMFNDFFRIGKKKIGRKQKLYIIGDIGLTNNGSLIDTFKLIDELSRLNVDAVKFQMLNPEILLGDKRVTYSYPTLKNGRKTENMYKMFSNLTYSFSEWNKIAKYCKKKQIEFICTSHFRGAVAILEKLNVKVHKICTWSLNHRRMIEDMGKTKKPLIIDTGACNEKEFQQLIKWYKSTGGTNLLVLHDFHTQNPIYMNFKAITYIKKKYKCVVGYTPQGRDDAMDLVALGLGAKVLEKRITLDRSKPKNGHYKALNVKEFKIWIKKIRNAEIALGSEVIKATPDDIEDSKKYFKSLYANKNILKGQKIKPDMIEERRPGTGISVSKIYEVFGKKAKKNISKGSILKNSQII